MTGLKNKDCVSLQTILQYFFHKFCQGIEATAALMPLVSISSEFSLPMCPPDLSSLKWGEDGELSANDTLLLVERLARAEQKANSSDKKHLNLSSLSNDSDEAVAS